MENNSKLTNTSNTKDTENVDKYGELPYQPTIAAIPNNYQQQQFQYASYIPVQTGKNGTPFIPGQPYMIPVPNNYQQQQPIIYLTETTNLIDESDRHPRGDTYFVLAIISLFCCPLPFGIMAFIYSLKLRESLRTGDAVSARQHAKVIRILLIVGGITIVAGITFFVVFFYIFSRSIY